MLFRRRVRLRCFCSCSEALGVGSVLARCAEEFKKDGTEEETAVVVVVLGSRFLILQKGGSDQAPLKVVFCECVSGGDG